MATDEQKLIEAKRAAHKASVLVDAQIEKAKELYISHFGGADNPHVMAAIIVAIATAAASQSATQDMLVSKVPQ